MTQPDLYDQEGYLIRLGVGGVLRFDGKLIRAADVSVVVNGDRWTNVTYVEIKEDVVDGLEMGGGGFTVPNGASGTLRLRSRRDDEGEPIVEPARRIMNLHPDSVLAVVVTDPADGHEIRRITCYGCKWGPPMARPVERRSSAGMMVTADFRAERYEDA